MKIQANKLTKIKTMNFQVLWTLFIIAFTRTKAVRPRTSRRRYTGIQRMNPTVRKIILQNWNYGTQGKLTWEFSSATGWGCSVCFSWSSLGTKGLFSPDIVFFNLNKYYSKFSHNFRLLAFSDLTLNTRISQILNSSNTWYGEFHFSSKSSLH